MIKRTYTIGYIDHDKDVHSKYLGPSMSMLNDEFSVISTSDEKFPAQNYNYILDKAKTDRVILTHQDVSFPPDLLERIDMTYDFLEERGVDVGALGMVGMDPKNRYTQLHSNEYAIFLVDTLDCCFVVVDPSNKVRFDEENFGDYHLYVEDYCAQLNRNHKKQNFTIIIDSGVDEIFYEYHEDFEFDKLRHHSATISKLGACWGRYKEFKKKLIKKWGYIKTT
jgi:hypothetical protein